MTMMLSSDLRFPLALAQDLSRLITSTIVLAGSENFEPCPVAPPSRP